MSCSNFLKIAKESVPKLCSSRHKGQSGRIGVVGGSLEYTGAPYFAAISALKTGADLVHVFCPRDAAPVIKSYSPELIVHPLLDSQEAVQDITPWLDRMHVLIIGPGLGRMETTFNIITGIVKQCRKLNLPLIFDADGLQWVKLNPCAIRNYKNVILTPNSAEFKHLFINEDKIFSVAETSFGNEIIVLQKGYEDILYDVAVKKKHILSAGGSGRRCGGQGDLLSGALGTFFVWMLQYVKENAITIESNLPAKSACAAASNLTKLCNAEAFKEHGRSMTCTDMINKIHKVFDMEFEHNV